MTTDERIKKLDDARNQLSSLQGALTAHLSRLQAEFGLTSEEDAQLRLAALNKEIEEDEAELADLTKKLDTIVDWEKL